MSPEPSLEEQKPQVPRDSGSLGGCTHKVVLLLDGREAREKWGSFAPPAKWKKLARTCACHVFAEVGWRQKSCFVISLSSDEKITELNREYRGKDGPTNVLSFPSYNFSAPMVVAEDFAEPAAALRNDYMGLGDIYLAFETIFMEASEYGISFLDHVSHLFVHSLLHLLGFDHVRPEDEEVMEALEVNMLGKIGVANPYD